ncbi:MAG: hypothetical protein HY234_11585 [Acidobacteria bacterium]|nr:hypothetical protein [Acidobacteriota bacterium]MBI3663675.1 hypothetical protein [Acidobacteriota bacterium]
MGFEDLPAGDDIAGAVVFQHDTRHRVQFQGVDLHQITGLGDAPVAGLAHHIGMRPFAGLEGAEQRLDQQAPFLPLGEDASHHRSRGALPLAAEQDDEIVFAPAGKLQAPLEDTLSELPGPDRLTAAGWSVRVILKTSQILRTIPAPPAI